MKKIFYTILIHMMLAVQAVAAPLDCLFDHYSSEDGLSHDYISQILQDRDGYIWISTWYGLNRFDGQRVVQFNCYDPERRHGNQNVSALFEDRNHILWIGTDEGVFCYNPEKDSFKFIDTKTAEGEQINTWISTIFQDPQGNIWICAPSQGVFRYDNEGRLQRPPPPAARHTPGVPATGLARCPPL